MLPTLTVVLAEIIVILLIALVAALFMHLRKVRRHRAEIDALMGIVEQFSSNGDCPAPAYQAGAAASRPADALSPPMTEKSDASRANGEPAAQLIDAELADRTDRDIAAIKQALATFEAQLDQSRHEALLLGKDLYHKVEAENIQMTQVKKELREVRESIGRLSVQYQSLHKDARRLREEAGAFEAHGGVGAASQRGVSSTTLQSSSRAALGSRAVADDFTLPESLLGEIEDLMKNSQEESQLKQVTASAAGQGNPAPGTAKTTKQPAADTGHSWGGATHPPARAADESAENTDKSAVDEPQFAFDPLRVEDKLNIPTFIPGSVDAGINVEEINYEEVNPEEAPRHPEEPGNRTTFAADRVFHQASTQSGIKPGWYFSLRGGKAHGPFGSKEAAERVLNEMIEQFKRTGDTSGR